jgi:hypothetical protein
MQSGGTAADSNCFGCLGETREALFELPHTWTGRQPARKQRVANGAAVLFIDSLMTVGE